MKKILFLIVVVVLVYGLDFVQDQMDSMPDSSTESQGASERIETAYRNKRGNFQIQGQGAVLRILPDDLDGPRHQRIVLEMDNGQSLLIAHNIDLAPRVSGLRKGDMLVFNGEYEWNSKGGVIHWTHKDLNRRHEDGWLKHRGRTYQ
jgi:hypothetical protein